MLRKFLVAVLITCLFASCKNDDGDKRLLEEYDKSIASGGIIINRGTENNLMELQNKLSDAATNVQAAIWYPRALAIHDTAKNLLQLLENAKTKAAGMGDNLQTIYRQLQNFKSSVLGDDEQMKETFKKQFDFIEEFIRLSGIKDTADFSAAKNISDHYYLRHVLTITQNAIRQTENRLIQYCNNKVTNNALIFDVYSAIIGQNAEILKKGSTLEITAGVGAFSRKIQPLILVGKDTAMIEEDGAAHYKIKVANQKDNYSVPVTISFIDQDGKKQVVEKNVTYTVKD